VENLSGDPDLAKKYLRSEIFLSGVSYQNTTDQQGEQSEKGWRRASAFCTLQASWNLTSNQQGRARPIRDHS
jgi:hypothetical protein